MRVIVLTFDGEIPSQAHEQRLAKTLQEEVAELTKDSTVISVDILSSNDVATILAREIIVSKVKQKGETVSSKDLVRDLCTKLLHVLSDQQAEVSTINIVQILLRRIADLNQHPGVRILTTEKPSSYELVCNEFKMKWLPKLVYDIHKTLPLY